MFVREVFVAYDGTEFKNRVECENYEAKSAPSNVKMFNVHGKEDAEMLDPRKAEDISDANVLWFPDVETGRTYVSIYSRYMREYGPSVISAGYYFYDENAGWYNAARKIERINEVMSSCNNLWLPKED